MSTNGHDAPPNGEVNPQSLAQGHEPDRVDLKPILYIGAALLITFFLTYTTVTLIVNYMREPTKEKPANELAAVNNEATLKERLNRINSSDDHAKVKQPRLEGLDRLEVSGNDPPYVRSTERTPEGNSPHYHPEDMRPSSQHGKELGLQSYSWVDESKGVVRIPIEEAMKLALTAKDPKNTSKNYVVSEDKVKPAELRAGQPTPSNGGSAPKEPSKAHDKSGGPH